NVYNDVTVDTWSADWDMADVMDMQISGDDTKKYTNLSFAGVEFTSQTIDASSMTHFHMDIWTPNETAEPAAFKIKLVDFGADGAFGGGDDVEHELTFTAATTPALVRGSWIALDIPLTEFAGLSTKAHLAQLIISGDLATVYVDNVYFYSSATSVRTPVEIDGFALGQNYPNPFNPSTVVPYDLDAAAHATLRVYTLDGKHVATLVDGWQAAGTHRVSFDAAGLPSGSYMVTLTVNGMTSMRKMQLTR
ncbi:MAG: T9SS type A sorting domain-containing protein, partial [Bacteroidota bacterium]|nr:T9SS type A sorting domain-containing protein [Bacteroidota bacterium]